jgi:ectoine hydroxylase-related dioxygenase (phytanoyl-CoA dioxygenase family)
MQLRKLKKLLHLLQQIDIPIGGAIQRRKQGKIAYRSKFASLWIDRVDALEELQRRASADRIYHEHAERLEFFIENGFVVIENAVSSINIDNYMKEFDRSLDAKNNSPLVASVPEQGPQDKGIVPAGNAPRYKSLTKYLDTYWFLPEARPLIFNEAAVQFLSLVFEEAPLAFQGLHFETGSTQAIHQDTAYVVAEKPLALVASWLALEDIKPGSGELNYYIGSHKLPDWKYSGVYKHFNHERDEREEHLRHLRFLHEESQRRGYPLQSFLPKKGDLLLWAADLAHGGAEIKNAELTRRSLVTHFCPASLRPNYFKYRAKNDRVILAYENKGYMSTLYY